jgi:hypothetical protein
MAARDRASAVAQANFQRDRQAAWDELESALRAEAQLADELGSDIEQSAESKASQALAAVDKHEAAYNTYKEIYSYNGTGMMEAFRIEEGMRNKRAAALQERASAVQSTLAPRKAALRVLEFVRDEGEVKTGTKMNQLQGAEAELTQAFENLTDSSGSRSLLSANDLASYRRRYSAHHKSFAGAAANYRKLLSRSADGTAAD